MTDKLRLEIEIGDFIRRVSLEELVQMTIFHNRKYVNYVEIGEKKMLINFLLDTSKRIKENEHLLKLAITETLFSEVNNYKRIIVYNHFRKTCSYTDDEEEIKKYDGTYVLQVLKFPSNVLETIGEAIVKKEKEDKN